jgi:hypothetical protein
MGTNFNHDKNYDDIKTLLNIVRRATLNEADEMINTTPEKINNKDGEELSFDGINTIGYLSAGQDITLNDAIKDELTSTIGEFIKATGLLLPYINIRVENGRMILTADVIKNPTLEFIKELVIDTDNEDPTVNLVGGTFTLNSDLLNLLNTISRSYIDPQIGRTALVKSTTSGGNTEEV